MHRQHFPRNIAFILAALVGAIVVLALPLAAQPGGGIPFQITQPTSLSDAVEGVSYNPVQVAASGGTPGYDFSVTGLPEGMSLDADDRIQGTPVDGSSNSYNVVIRATDSAGGIDSRALVLVVNPTGPELEVSEPGAFPNATEDVAYGPIQVAATGGVPPYTFTVEGLPQGLSLNGSDEVEGVPADGSSGSYSVRVNVTDDVGGLAWSDYQLNVGSGSPLRITTSVYDSDVYEMTVGEPYRLEAEAVGGTPPYSWEWDPAPTRIDGMSVSGNVLSGTPTGTVDGGNPTSLPYSYPFDFSMYTFPRIRVRDSSDPQQTHNISIPFQLQPNFNIANPSLPAACRSFEYPAATLEAEGGSGNFEWGELTELPSGLRATGHTVLGTLAEDAALGTWAQSVRLTDSSSGSWISQSVNIRVYDKLEVVSFDMPTAYVGRAFDVEIGSRGGSSQAYRHMEVEGLPPGLEYEGTSPSSDAQIRIFGQPSPGGELDSPYTLVFTLTDDELPYLRVTKEVTFHVATSTLVLDPEQLDTARVDRPYSAVLNISGGVEPYQVRPSTDFPDGVFLEQDIESGDWFVVSDSIPSELVRADAHIFEFEVEDSSVPDRLLETLTCEFNVVDHLTILNANLPQVVVGESYRVELVSVGGIDDVSWVIQGAPAGITPSEDAATGRWHLAGVLEVEGSFLVTLTATDSGTPSEETRAQLVLNVVANHEEGIAIRTSHLPVARAGEFYGPLTLDVDGATEPDWSDTIGLPTGLSVDHSADGTWSIAGTLPGDVTGTFNVQLVVRVLR